MESNVNTAKTATEVNLLAEFLSSPEGLIYKSKQSDDHDQMGIDFQTWLKKRNEAKPAVQRADELLIELHRVCAENKEQLRFLGFLKDMAKSDVQTASACTIKDMVIMFLSGEEDPDQKGTRIAISMAALYLQKRFPELSHDVVGAMAAYARDNSDDQEVADALKAAAAERAAKN